MDNFHRFEVIGRGKYSTVYKGRKKKSFKKILAIKRVDKSQKSAVLEEVKLLQSLDHSNVLKCYAWHETCADLWLILEYCGGGDLQSLLKEDSNFPEDSVYDLASELVSGLRYLHSKGIVYCDLKPSNILLDANGHTKLGDFGLARKSRDISKTPSSLQLKRGTPCYMAPELFHDGGVHSYASDLWTLGCVLYECYAGRPPFRGKEFTQLAKSILNDPTPSLPGYPSGPFADLMNSLLIKDPADRIQWSEIRTHAYWITQMSPLSLPPQPAFDKMIQRLYYKPSCPPNHEIKTTPKNRKKKKKKKKKNQEAEEQKEDVSRVVNLQRLSRIAKVNLQREDKKKYPTRPLLHNTVVEENDNVKIKIKNTDMELDFNENTEEDETPTTTIDEENLTSKPEDKEERHEIDSSPDGDESITRSSEHESKTQTTDDESSAAEVFFHPSDLLVLPVVIPSKKLSSDNYKQYFQYSLPFDPIPSSDFVKLPKEQLDAVTKSIVTSLLGEKKLFNR